MTCYMTNNSHCPYNLKSHWFISTLKFSSFTQTSLNIFKTLWDFLLSYFWRWGRAVRLQTSDSPVWRVRHELRPHVERCSKLGRVWSASVAELELEPVPHAWVALPPQPLKSLLPPIAAPPSPALSPPPCSLTSYPMRRGGEERKARGRKRGEVGRRVVSM